MKISILVTFVVLPMFVSIGLYCYAFLSTNWIYLDNKIISKYNSTSKQRQEEIDLINQTIQFEYRLTRQEFRSQYGLFGYCLDSKWLNLLYIKSNSTFSSSSQCDSSLSPCPEINPCAKECNSIPECPSHNDEDHCIRNYNQTHYYWKEKKCIWHSFLSDVQVIPRWLLSYFRPSVDIYNAKTTRYYMMLILFIMAPILTLLGLLVLCCMNCVDRFYSIPFIFVSCFSLASFLTGASGLGIFLYEWINERFYQYDYTKAYGQIQQSTITLNPWVIHVEHFGLAFWVILAAIGINFLTTLLSCCFCWGLQSDKSKLRIYVHNDKYAVIHTGLYDE